ncbi:MAG: hypothetical protein JST26_05540 [Bacteroidetes bacterium]|nr:hypothetical protein [Bacteroidota bacterium]
MVIPIPSHQQQFKVKVGIRAYEPCALGVNCYDASKPNTDYIRRRIPFSQNLFKAGNRGYKEFTLPFPLSPDQLMIEFYDKAYGDDASFKLEKFELEKMPARSVWAEPEIHRFIGFAQDFALQAGYLPTGVYDSKDGDFLIQYLPIIEDEWGNALVTPARTNRKSGRIQVSQTSFVGYTIPVRLVVLFHERYHFQIPTRLEKPADLHGLRLYLDLGFPRTEAVYATTKIFNSHPESVGPNHSNRVKDIVDFIDNYSGRENLKMNDRV